MQCYITCEKNTIVCKQKKVHIRLISINKSPIEEECVGNDDQTTGSVTPITTTKLEAYQKASDPPPLTHGGHTELGWIYDSLSLRRKFRRFLQ